MVVQRCVGARRTSARAGCQRGIEGWWREEGCARHSIKIKRGGAGGKPRAIIIYAYSKKKNGLMVVQRCVGARRTSARAGCQRVIEGWWRGEGCARHSIKKKRERGGEEAAQYYIYFFKKEEWINGCAAARPVGVRRVTAQAGCWRKSCTWNGGTVKMFLQIYYYINGRKCCENRLSAQNVYRRC